MKQQGITEQLGRASSGAGGLSSPWSLAADAGSSSRSSPDASPRRVPLGTWEFTAGLTAWIWTQAPLYAAIWLASKAWEFVTCAPLLAPAAPRVKPCTSRGSLCRRPCMYDVRGALGWLYLHKQTSLRTDSSGFGSWGCECAFCQKEMQKMRSLRVNSQATPKGDDLERWVCFTT